MFKLNKKGFALAETIIAATFVLAIFTMIYTNLLPLMGKYEKRENYDDIDSLYKTYYIKNHIESHGTTKNLGLYELTYLCESVDDYCKSLLNEFGVVRIFLTDYSISYKQDMPNDMSDYVNTIKVGDNANNCAKRIIVEYEVEDENKKVHRFSTIGVCV